MQRTSSRPMARVAFPFARFQTLAALAVGSVVVAMLVAPVSPTPIFSSRSETPAAQHAAPAPASSAWVQDAYARLPLSFEQNIGQTDPKVDFIARGSGYSLFLT